jgi:hypothetical protein
VSIPALTPERALSRLTDTSGEIRAAVLLSPDDEVAAHSLDAAARGAELAGLVSELIEAARSAREEPVAELEIGLPGGMVFAVCRDGWTAGAVTRRPTLSSVVRYDLDRLLCDLAGQDR